MLTTEKSALAKRALADIDRLLNNYDHGGQIESALPLLLRHRRTLAQLCGALRPIPSEIKLENDDERWVDDLVTIFGKLGGQGPHPLVYRKMKERRIVAGRSWPPNARSVIRQTLQAHCAASLQYCGGPDLFRMIRPGLWGLKNN